MSYLFAEPVIKVPKGLRPYRAPASQMGLCLSVLGRTNDEREVVFRLQDEYLAIVEALILMGLEFHILKSYVESFDQYLIRELELRGCQFVTIEPGRFGAGAFFPGDFCVSLSGGLILVNEDCEVCLPNNGFVHSPYARRGSMLSSGNNVLLSNRVNSINGYRAISYYDTEPFTAHKLLPGIFPTFICRAISEDREEEFTNDQIDRVASLLRGQDGSLHLIIDPQMEGAKYWGSNKKWEVMKQAELVTALKQWYRDIDIEIHVPRSPLQIPYALNLLQFPDGRVLMTSGDEALKTLVERIVGSENVVTTRVPIEFYPAWMYLGLRQLVGDLPQKLQLS